MGILRAILGAIGATAEAPEWIGQLRKGLTTLAAILAAILAGLATLKPVNPIPHQNPNGTDAACPPAPAVPPAPTAPAPWEALLKIQFGNAGCTGTIIGSKRADGRYDILTAAHCLKGQPHDGVAVMRIGKSFRVSYVVSDEQSDIAWLVTTEPQTELPYALLAEGLPKAGDDVYHGGFGVDRPGNREVGTVVNPDNGSGQTQYRLSVSSGDSGGGIAFTRDGRVLGPVCCTTGKGRVADVWAGTVVHCRKLRPTPMVVLDEWTPIDIPIRMPE